MTSRRIVLDLILFGLVIAMQWRLAAWTGWQRRARLAFWLAAAWEIVATMYGLAMELPAIPAPGPLQWLRGGAYLLAFFTVAVFAAASIFHLVPAFDPSRRRILAGTLAGAPAAIGAAAVIDRNSLRVVERNIAIPGLPEDLDGLRLAQLSDIHLGPFLGADVLRRAVAMANETRPHIILVTGDLITSRDYHLMECLDLLGQLRSEAGVLGCLGNHEAYARCEERTKAEGARRGIEFLRHEKRGLRFGEAKLNIAGVDHQWSGGDYLTGAGQLVDPGCPNLLLSHNPAVFPVAARQGWDLTLSGHTHGGQITAGIFGQYLNPSRIFTSCVYGIYHQGDSSIYVTRGIGTVGVPARVGAPAEIGLIRLCAT